MGLDNKDLGAMLDHIEGQEQAQDVALTVTHRAPENAAEVDTVQQELLQMLAENDLLPPSDSADLAGYPGLSSQG